MVQLSLKLLVVPVLTLTVLPGTLSTELVPKAAARALLSERMCEIRKLVSSDSTRSPSRIPLAGLYSKSVCPEKSVIFRIGWRGTLTPELAKTPNAVPISSMVTSPPPRVKDSP